MRCTLFACALAAFQVERPGDNFNEMDKELQALQAKTKSYYTSFNLNSPHAAPSSFIEEAPKDKDNFMTLHKNLQESMKKAKAEMEALDTWEKKSPGPSSFLQTEEAPNSFADLDAKLKQLEEKTKSELAKLKADAAPSSLLEKGSPDSFADIDAKLKQLEEKTKSELAKLKADAGPTSFVQIKSTKSSGTLMDYERTHNLPISEHFLDGAGAKIDALESRLSDPSGASSSGVTGSLDDSLNAWRSADKKLREQID